MRFLCAGVPVGVYSKAEAKKLGFPDREGHVKREPCGKDQSALIAKVPEDGEEHKIKCSCGKTVIKVRKTAPEE